MTNLLIGSIIYMMMLSYLPWSKALILPESTTVNPIYNRIDPRYEDDMVHPALTCTQRGIFAHPRNCARFYVCDSSELSPDYFRKDFFDCAPGTTFVQNTTNSGFCNVTSDSSKCGGDVVTTDPDITTTFPECNRITCPPTLEECQIGTLCPSGSTEPLTMTLCKKSFYDCSFCQDQSPCESGLWYHAKQASRTNDDTPMCYESPDKMICCNDCHVSAYRCQPKNVCIEGQMKSKLLCPTAAKVCEPCGKSTSLCESGFLYSITTGQCFDAASVDEPCSETNGFAVASRFNSAKPMDVIHCSGRETIVKLEKYCKKYPFCSKKGLFMGSHELCSTYYHCNYNVVDHSWIARKSKCPEGMLYSHENGICLSKSKNICNSI